jgi:ornithine cyclodeaminase
MRVLNADDVRKALPMDVAIEAMRRAFAALSQGAAEVPARTHLPIRPHDGVTLVMSAFVDDADGALAVKVVSLFARNAERGLARLQAAVIALDPQTGRPAALLEGAALTAIRTGAASGLATELLARPDSHTAAVIGAGVQGRTQLEAVCTVRRIQAAWVYDPRPEQVRAFLEDVAGRGRIPGDVRAAADARQAVAEADVICTATTAATPVFSDADLKRGVHVNAVGSYQPHVQEIPAETICRSLLVVDSRQAALAETGDLIQPIRSGLLRAEHIHAELGELVLKRRARRTSAGQITLFKSVGVAVQDAAAARAALRRAEQQGLGSELAW